MQSTASAEPERKAEGTALAKAWRPAVQGRTQRLGPVGGGGLRGGSPGGGWDGQVGDPVKPGIGHVTSAGGRLGGPGLCFRGITTYSLGGGWVRSLGPGVGPMD